MINTACKPAHQSIKNRDDNVTQLRLLRNKFLRQYGETDRQLSSQSLTAFLLYFALRLLEHNNGLHVLLGNSILANQHVTEMTSENLVSIGKELFDLTQCKLPVNLRQVMTIPNEVSWRQAKIFFETNVSDFEFADTANLGFAYQIFSLGMRAQQALPALQKADKKIGRQELIGFTQLYTPNWVVDFLVANTVLPVVGKTDISKRYRQWLMPNQMQETDLGAVFQLSLLDPACGAGQFLFSAFDLLMELSERADINKSEAAKIILSQNIFGADIDEKGLWVSGLGLTLKSLLVSNSLSDNLLNLFLVRSEHLTETVAESNFLGSIDKRLPGDHALRKLYKVIVTNPPYLGRKLLSRGLKSALKEQYPKSSNDLASAFIESCADMLEPEGRFGVITQASLLAIPSYKALRDHLIGNYHWQFAVRCGPGVFPLASGEKIDSLLLLLRAPLSKAIQTKELKTCFVDLSNDKEKSKTLVSIISDSANMDNKDPRIISTNQENMQYAGSLFSGLSSAFLNKISQFPKLGDIAEIRQGLATTDNGRFVRYFFDVDKDQIGSEWIPYVKGAGSERYASNNLFVVKWGDNGKEIKKAVVKAYPYLKGKTAWVVKNEEYYFRPGLCFSFINKTGLAVRRLPAGAIFDVASSAIFAAPEEEDFLLAYLNSTFVGVLAKSINQSINLQVGDLKKIPICPFEPIIKSELSLLGRRCFEVKQKLLDLKKFDSCLRLPALITSQYLEELFVDCQNREKLLRSELGTLENEIEKKVKIGIKQLGILNTSEESVFDNWENIRACEMATWQYVDIKIFAAKFLAALVARVLLKEGEERVVSMSQSPSNSFAQFFNISDSAQNWLENKLDKFLEELFCQSKILDISKLGGDPSRYFSVWSNYDNACLFFSAVAIRNLIKNPKDLSWQSILRLNCSLDSLKGSDDWTSNDLLKVFLTLRTDFR